MTDFDKKMVLGVLGALGAYLVYRKVANALPTGAQVVEAFNPTSEKNLAYRAASGATKALTGDESFGGWIYDVTHDTSFITKTPAPKGNNPAAIDNSADPVSNSGDYNFNLF